MDFMNVQQQYNAIKSIQSTKHMTAELFDFYKHRDKRHCDLIQRLVHFPLVKETVSPDLVQLILALFESQRADMRHFLREMSLLKTKDNTKMAKLKQDI